MQDPSPAATPPQIPPTTKPSLTARLLVAGISILLILAISEGTLRMVGIGNRDIKPTDVRTGLRTFPPNKNIPYRTSCYSNVLRINQDGFHARDHARQKPPNTIRIVILGDSFVEGAQVDRDKVFPAVLEDLLNAHASGTHVEVIAIGQGGNGTYANLQYLAAYGISAQPDIVIDMYNINDVDNDAGYDHFSERVAEIVDGTTVDAVQNNPVRSGDVSALMAGLKTLAKKSALVVTAYTAYLNTRAHLKPAPTENHIPLDWASMYLVDLPPDAAEAWSRQEALFKALRDVTQRDGAKFMLASITADNRVNGVHYNEARATFPPETQTGSEELEKRLTAAANTLNIPYIKTLDAFSERQNTFGSAGFPCDGHYNEAGNRYMAEILDSALSPLLWNH